jgi:hypothetical protein
LLGCDEPTVKKPTPANLSCANGSVVQGVNAIGEPNCIAPANATTLALSHIAGVVSISSSTVAITTAENGDGLDLAMPSSDPFYAASTAASITSTDVSTWRALAAAGDHAAAGYFTDETDEVFAASPAAGITSLSAWDTASTWGDHAAGGYLRHEQDAFVGSLAAGKRCSRGETMLKRVISAASQTQAWVLCSQMHGAGQMALRSTVTRPLASRYNGPWCWGQAVLPRRMVRR